MREADDGWLIGALSAQFVGWYGSTPARIDRFNLDDERALVAADVDRLVQAMAQFGPTPAPGSVFTPLIANPLAPVLAASWQSLA